MSHRAYPPHREPSTKHPMDRSREYGFQEDNRFGDGAPQQLKHVTDRYHDVDDRPRQARDRPFGHRSMNIEVSTDLWVGNITMDVTEEALMDHFSRFGEVDSVTIHYAKNYAFVNFKDARDAAEARHGLQGTVVNGGLPLKIEFSRGARQQRSYPTEPILARPPLPSRHIIASGASPAISKRQIEAEFQRYGRIEGFRVERNLFYIDFAQIEDAVAAVEGLNGKFLGDSCLTVEYARLEQPLKDDRMVEREDNGSFYRERERPDVGDRVAYTEGEPSQILWVGFPPYLKITDDILYREFRAYGEVVNVRTFPGRTYAFVHFSRPEHAIKARRELDGKFLEEPRVRIKFANGSAEPARDEYQASRGHAGRDSDPPGRAYPVPPRASGPRRGHEGRNVGDPRLRSEPSRVEQGPSMYHRHGGEEWEEERPRGGPKRSRMDAGFKDEEPMLYNGRGGSGFDSLPHGRQDVGGMRGGPMDRRGGGFQKDSFEGDAGEGAPWVGALSKGGTFVCRAMAFPVGKGIAKPLPEVVNCIARTDLDVLSKHILAASSFGVVAVVPADKVDIAPYEDFVQYLGEKRRAGVAKCLDGSSLFLVPPSDFSQQVLDIPQKDALFGVVLTLPKSTGSQYSGQGQSQPQQQQHVDLKDSSASTKYQPDAPGPYQPHPPLLAASQPTPGVALPAGLTADVLASLTALLPQNRSQGGGAPAAAPYGQYTPGQQTQPQYGNLPSPQNAPRMINSVKPPQHFPPQQQQNLGVGQDSAPVPAALQFQPDQLAQLSAMLAQVKRGQGQPVSAGAAAASQPPLIAPPVQYPQHQQGPWRSPPPSLSSAQQQYPPGGHGQQSYTQELGVGTGIQVHYTYGSGQQQDQQPQQQVAPPLLPMWETSSHSVAPAITPVQPAAGSYNVPATASSISPVQIGGTQQSESEAKRFQTTLSLAAALLQQMQQQQQRDQQPQEQQQPSAGTEAKSESKTL